MVESIKDVTEPLLVDVEPVLFVGEVREKFRVLLGKGLEVLSSKALVHGDC